MQMIRTRNGSSRRRFTQAYFEQNDPHPDPLPSDGRGNRQTRLWQPPKRWDTPTDGGRFSLSHPMGEGRGEGECGAKSEVVFARLLTDSGQCGLPANNNATHNRVNTQASPRFLRIAVVERALFSV